MPQTHEPTPQQIKEQQLYREMGLSDEEFAKVEEILGRMPNYTETGIFAVMWSEHCSYKIPNRFYESFRHLVQGYCKAQEKVQVL